MKSLCVYIESVLFNYETFHIKKTWWGRGGMGKPHKPREEAFPAPQTLKLVGF